MKKFDLIIIGGGRASNLAVTAGKLGKKVALIEKSSLGGTCPNRGCVPSKLLIGYAHVARSIKESSRHFIESSIQHIDVEQIFKETNKFISKIDNGYANKFNENVTIFRGRGSFIANNIVKVNEDELSAPHIVIATGTRPMSLPHEKAWSSDDIFPLESNIPKSITIVGSGFIATELANFFAAVDIPTKLLVRGDRLLSNEDHEISDIFKTEYSKIVDVEFNTTIDTIDYDKGFNLTLINKEGEKSTHQSESLLYATGREANSDLLGLENTDIELTDRGFIKRDEFFETTSKGVYVVGDASGEHMLQHAAAYEVNYLGKILYQEEKEPLKFKYMPHAVFTDPEIASVGATSQKLDKEGVEYVSATVDWWASARAQSIRLKYPRTKLLINPKNYEILGCHMIGPESSTMMHQVLAIMNLDNDVRHLKDMLYIHPALSEALLPAAVNAVKEVEAYNSTK